MKTTLIYYTNNIVPRNLLLRTLNAAIDVSTKINADLVITSHFPLSNDPVYVNLNSDQTSDQEIRTVDKLIVTGEFFDNRLYPNIKSFVVGRLPSAISSLVKQLIFTLSQVNTETVVFLEHDILYPNVYFERVLGELEKGHDFVFVKTSLIFQDGFTEAKEVYFLSRYSGKTQMFLQHFRKSKPRGHLEPLPRSANIPPAPFADPDPKYDNFSIIDIPFPVLDIKHGLNLTPFSMINRDVRDFDSYWGKKEDVKRLIEMPESFDGSLSSKLYMSGLEFALRNKQRGSVPSVRALFDGEKLSGVEEKFMKFVLENSLNQKEK